MKQSWKSEGKLFYKDRVILPEYSILTSLKVGQEGIAWLLMWGNIKSIGNPVKCSILAKKVLLDSKQSLWCWKTSYIQENQEVGGTYVIPQRTKNPNPLFGISHIEVRWFFKNKDMKD